jgi:hypothetical protein
MAKVLSTLEAVAEFAPIVVGGAAIIAAHYFLSGILTVLGAGLS